MTTGKIYSLIPKIMNEVGAIEKTRRNQQQGYAFRGIDDVYSAFQGPLAKHGVFVAPEVLSEAREERQTKAGGTMIYTVLRMKFRFYAEDGSFVECVTVGEAMDSGDKSSNKAMSTAMKYAMYQLFCIPTYEDNDTENQSPDVAPRPPVQPQATARAPIPNPFQKPAPPSGEAPPVCCGALMRVSQFTDRNFPTPPWYCGKCRNKEPRSA